MKTEFEGKINFILLNANAKEVSEQATKDNIRSVPTLILYDKEGVKKNTLVGGKSKEDLKKELDKLLE